MLLSPKIKQRKRRISGSPRRMVRRVKASSSKRGSVSIDENGYVESATSPLKVSRTSGVSTNKSSMSHPLRVASSNPISDADDKVIGKCSNNNKLPKSTSLSLFKSLFQKTAVNQRIRRTHGNTQTTDSNTLIQPNEVPNRRTACEEDMMDVDEDDRNILETKQVARQNNALRRSRKCAKTAPSALNFGKSNPWRKSDFVVGRALGKGKYGMVYLARQRRTLDTTNSGDGFKVGNGGEYGEKQRQQSRTNVALKVLFKSSIIKGGPLALFHLRREVEIQSRLIHPNVCRLFGFFVDETHAYLTLEYCSNGMLYKLLREKKYFSEERTVRYAIDIARALAYCHERHVIHRDIKLENLLIDENGSIKLADFGWSVHVPPTAPPEELRRTTLCGTPEYLSPEIVAGTPHNKATDIWSFGVLIYEFLHGKTPFVEPDEEKMFDRILTCDIRWNENPRIALSSSATKFIKKLLQVDMEKRLSAKNVVIALERWVLMRRGGK